MQAIITTSCSMDKSKRKLKAPKKPKERHRVAKSPGQGVRLTSLSKIIVERVREFFEKEKRHGQCILRNQVLQRTAEATGIAKRTIYRIHKEVISRDGQLLTPVKRYTLSRVRVNPNSFDRGVIRRVVHAFFERKEYPTVSSVLKQVKDQCGFPGGRFRVLRDMGFTYKKRNNKLFIYEQSDIVEQRHMYLQAKEEEVTI